MTGSVVARMLFAVTIMVAALLLAPTPSFAHAGHDHGPTVTDVSKRPVVQDFLDQGHEQNAESVTAQPHSLITQSGGAGKTKIVCTGGCCTAASPSCCAVSTAALVGLLEPPYGHAVFVIAHAEGAGIVPGTLPEPPKSLV